MRRVHDLSGGAILLAAVCAVAAAARATDAASSPIVPPGGWRVVWVASVVAAFVLYGLGSLAARRAKARLGVAVAVAVAVQIVPLFGPLLLSRDVYLYWAEARVVTVHHANPYVSTPSDYPADPATGVASAQWRDEPEPYGPAWVALGSVPAALAGTSSRHAQLLYRLLSVGGMLLVLGVLARRTRNAAAVTFVGWNPLIALHVGGGGHTDVWLAVALVVGVCFRGTRIGGTMWPLGAAIKVVPAILLPLELARTRGRSTRRWWVAFSVVGAAVILAATAAFGLHWVSGISAGAHLASPVGGVHILTELGVRHRYAVVACGLVFAAIYAVLFRQAWQTGRARLSLAATSLCLCSSLLRPWYAIWPVALAGTEDDNLAVGAAYLLTGYLLFADAVDLWS